MLSFNKLEFDLNQVKFGQSANFPVEITNNSIGPIVVNNSGSSCSCTTGAMSRNPIEPTTTQIFTVNFDSNKAGRGVQQKSITISWDYNNQHFSQTIKFKVDVIN